MSALNRRELATALLAAAPMAAQPPAQQPIPPPQELLDAARRQVQSNRAELDKFKLPMAVEPSFRFQA